jgi:hypothetical protein
MKGKAVENCVVAPAGGREKPSSELAAACVAQFGWMGGKNVEQCVCMSELFRSRAGIR